ncbi:MAG: TetR/AcrR family transcriptional regulator [Bifidobacterium sp.]|nr:TetR/AcrR family transcriptional regulator [Bifidobacterium sp.]
MYRTSNDPRFTRSRDALQRAFMDLTLEQGHPDPTVKAITERAGVNRMTFYAHYDSVRDILQEMVDAMIEEILGDSGADGMETVLRRATDCMAREMDFFRVVAADGHSGPYREGFRRAFMVVIGGEARREGKAMDPVRLDVIASGVTYAYFDWLTGRFGDMGLDDFCSRLALAVR